MSVATLHVGNTPVSADNPVPISGGSGGSSGLTDAQLRASAVPVSGPLTDTQLRASAVKMIADASAATGGVLGAKVLSAATTNATVVKATPGRVYGLQLSNTATAYRYFKFYNIATAPVVGTTPVIAIVGVPPGGRASLSSVQGMYFSAGIAYSIVTGAADADTTATAAGEVAGSVSYL